MNYCKPDGVPHNAATGFLNQADRLVIELQQRRQRSKEERTIPDPRGLNITQHSQGVRSCCTGAMSPNNCRGALQRGNETALYRASSPVTLRSDLTVPHAYTRMFLL